MWDNPRVRFCFPYQTANKAETIASLPFRRLNRTCDETNTGQHPHQPPTQRASVSRELPQGCEVTQCTLMWFHKNNGYEEMANCRERTRAVLTLAICSSTIQCLMDSTILWKGKITEQLIRKEVTSKPNRKENVFILWLTQVVSFKCSIFCRKNRKK